jgi:hypothetical protein
LTAFYEVPVDAAVGAALVLHAATFAPVTIVGMAWMVRDGLTFRGMVNLTSSAAPRGDAAGTSEEPGVGGFHAAVQVGLTAFYEVPVDAAVGAALVLHAATFAPVTIVGMAWMVRDGLTFRGMVNLTSSAAPRGDAAGTSEEPVPAGAASLGGRRPA